MTDIDNIQRIIDRRLVFNAQITVTAVSGRNTNGQNPIHAQKTKQKNAHTIY